MPPLPFCCFVPGAGDESAHFSFRHAEGWGRFAPPGAGCFWQTLARRDFALRREALLARPKRAEKAA